MKSQKDCGVCLSRNVNCVTWLDVVLSLCLYQMSHFINGSGLCFTDQVCQHDSFFGTLAVRDTCLTNSMAARLKAVFEARDLSSWADLNFRSLACGLARIAVQTRSKAVHDNAQSHSVLRYLVHAAAFGNFYHNVPKHKRLIDTHAGRAPFGVSVVCSVSGLQTGTGQLHVDNATLTSDRQAKVQAALQTGRSLSHIARQVWLDLPLLFCAKLARESAVQCCIASLCCKSRLHALLKSSRQRCTK